MAVYNGDTRVFYNEDCGKWGVEKITKGIVLHCKDGITRQLYKWSQVDPHPSQPNKSAYTPYYKVACRWSEKFKEGILVHVDMEEEQKTISPATAMHYAETVGKMPPRYKQGERFYTFTCEGDFYTVDIRKDDAPEDMNKTWAKEVNDEAKRIVLNMCAALCGSTFQTKEELNNHACYTAR